jgi:hypothetical protein
MKGIIMAKSMGKKGTICGPNSALEGGVMPLEVTMPSESNPQGGRTSPWAGFDYCKG